MAIVALLAIVCLAAREYDRSHRSYAIAVPGARAVYTPTEQDVKSLMFSDNGNVLAAAGAHGSIQTWRTATTWEITRLPVSERQLTRMAISPDGRWLAVTDSGDEAPAVRRSVLRLFRLNHGVIPLAEMGSIEEATAVADSRLYSGTSLAFSPDGLRIASGAFRTIEIRDRSSLQVVQSLSGQFQIATLLRFSDDGSFLAVGDNQGAIVVFDLRNGKPTFVRNATLYPTRTENAGLFGHYQGIRSMVFTHDAASLISLGGDNHLKVWDIQKDSLISHFRIGELSGWADRSSVLALTADEKYILTASKTGELGLWNLASGQKRISGTIPPLPTDYYLWELAMSRDGKSLAALIGKQNQFPIPRIALWETSDLFASSLQAPPSPDASPASVETKP
jgi:WD40 repeat protein